MVDALHQAHTALRAGALLVDLRPDGSRRPRVLRDRRVVGHLLYASESLGDDAAADAAVETMIGEGRFRRLRAGHAWYGYRFPGLDELDAYVGDSGRMAGYSPRTRERLARRPQVPISIRRAAVYQFLERV
ncbi:MAG: hypothetical protein ABR525_03215 [Candidatus Limnocylindria bacterium]